MMPPITITVAQMPLAALLSALAFTLADLLARSPLIAPRVSRAFARARASPENNEKRTTTTENGGGKEGVHFRAREQSLVAVVEDAGIKLVGMLHVLLSLPLAVAVLLEKRNASSLTSSSSSLTFSSSFDENEDPRLLLYSSTPMSRLLVSLSSGYFLWDIVSILIRMYVATTARGKREGRSVGGGFLAHGKSSLFHFSIPRRKTLHGTKKLTPFLSLSFVLFPPTKNKTTGAVCCCLFGLGALTGRLSHFAATFLLWEASTPFVYLRWALSAAGEKGKKSKAYTFAGLAMMSSFFVARIAFGTRFAFEFWGSCLAELRAPLPLSVLSSGPSSSSSRVSSLFGLGGGAEGDSSQSNIPAPVLVLILGANLGMNSLNLFWFSKMLSGAVKHLRPSSKTKEKTGAKKTAATAATPTTEEVSSQKEEEGRRAATATATTAAKTLNRRVFSMRSTSSGLEASIEGKAAAAALAPLTPERRVR